jgi:gliding motility-associated-like protein
MKKNIIYALFSLLACLSSYYSADGHAGVGIVVKDGCDRYLAIGTWHHKISELNSTINSTRGLYIDINDDGNFVNCCNGTSSSEFFIFTDYTIPNTPVSWNSITAGSSTIAELVNYFNNSTVYNSANLSNRFTAEKVWNPGCIGNKKLQSWIILKLPSSLSSGTTYNCRTSTKSVVETPCNIPFIFQITFGSDINITGDDTLLCESDSLILTSSAAPDLEWFRNGVLIQGPNDDSTITVLQSGDYTVRKGGIGCQSRTSEIYEVAFHPQPKAHFTIDDSLECFRDHEIVAINKSTLAQGTLQSLTWTTDSIDYLNIDTLNQVYSSANDYTIQLTVESDQGCFDSLTKAVTIYPMPVAQFMPDTTHLCERGNVFAIDYQGSISAGSIYKLWSFGDEISSTTADDTTKSYATFGSYTVRLELVSDFDCRDTTEQTLTVHPQPKAQFTIDDSLQCFRDHEIVAINKSTVAQGTVQSLTWTTDSIDYLNIDTLNQVYSSANDYTIQLTVESDQGCFDSLTKAVTIYPMPVAQFMPDTTHLCERGNVFAIDYQGSISAGSIYKLWSFGDGVYSTTADDTTKSYATFGSYTVRLELVSDFDCRDTTEQTLTVHPQPKAQFTIDDSLQCFRDHEIVAINKSILAQGAVQSRTWTTESTDYLNIDTLNQVYSSANDYTIQLTIESDQGCFDSLTKAVTIYPRPIATFLLDTSEQSCFEFQFINTSIGDKIQPFWTIKNADLSSTFYIEDNPKHRLDKLVDSVFACLKVSDKNGCSDSVCLAFPNKFKESLHLYNVFTPDDDGYNDNYLVDIVGASEFLLYIYNRFGDQMFFTEDPKNGWNGKFQNSGISLPEGTYFYIVEYRMLCTEKQERISGIIELIR